MAQQHTIVTKTAGKGAGQKNGGGGPLFLGVLVLVVTGLVGLMVYLSKGTVAPTAPGTGNQGSGTGNAISTTKGTAQPLTAEVAAKIEGYLASAKNIGASDPGKAEAILREAISAYPESQALYLAQADVLMAQKKHVDAYGAYERAIAVGPRDAKMDFMAGTVADLAGKPDRALEHYGAARQADPSNWEVPLYMARVQMKLNMTTEAKTNLLTAAKLEPDRAIVWGMLGELYLKDGSPAVALEQIIRARKIEPGVVAWRLIEARALKRLDRVDESLALLVGLPKEEQHAAGVLQLMGECYGLLNMPGEAADLYKGASDADAGNGQLAFDAAIWLERAGRKEQAIEYAKRSAMSGTPNAEKLQKRLSGVEVETK